MNNDIQPGHYVVAVSGGVDSVVLLDLLSRLKQLKLTVAHFDHGIRPDSAVDQLFVKQLAAKYDLPYVYEEGQLGAEASEATARQARYEFLHQVRKQADAKAVVTAHHQDDVIETALLNTWRGTGRKGLTAMQSSDIVKRPLLQFPKQQLFYYARSRDLSWREDSTNKDLRYKRNQLRYHLQRKLTSEQRANILKQIAHMHKVNQAIDIALTNHLHVQPHISRLDRRYFVALDHKIALELMAAWLRRQQIRDFNRRGLERIVIAAKTYTNAKQFDINAHHVLLINHDTLALAQRDR